MITERDRHLAERTAEIRQILEAERNRKIKDRAQELERKKNWRRRARETLVRKFGVRVVLVETNQSFPSIADAARATGVKENAIKEQLKRGGRLHDGRRFAFAGQESIEPRLAKRNKGVRRLSDGAEFVTISEAVRNVDVRVQHCEHNALCKAIKRGKPFKGSLWEFIG